ncbi:MAG: fluoride efflux transporter CrcB [Thermodesulfobacteriota bacterium]
MIKILIICIGGSLGAALRYLVSSKINDSHNTGFPFGTLAVNVIGCFLIGFLWHMSDYLNTSENLRLFIFVGLLGAFTTFSTFGFESHYLFSNNSTNLGIIYIVASNLFGITFVFLGLILSRNIFRV